jgi:hypothetical protein
MAVRRPGSNHYWEVLRGTSIARGSGQFSGEERAVPKNGKEPVRRDDAEEQPESGYPHGRLPTTPSAEAPADEKDREAQTGSEAEFDSTKPVKGTR